MNSPLNTPRQFLALNSEGVVLEDNTPVFRAQALLIIKKSKGVTATTEYPVEEKVVYTVENSERKTVCGLWFETVIYVGVFSTQSQSSQE